MKIFTKLKSKDVSNNNSDIWWEKHPERSKNRSLRERAEDAIYHLIDYNYIDEADTTREQLIEQWIENHKKKDDDK